MKEIGFRSVIRRIVLSFETVIDDMRSVTMSFYVAEVGVRVVVSGSPLVSKRGKSPYHFTTYGGGDPTTVFLDSSLDPQSRCDS